MFQIDIQPIPAQSVSTVIDDVLWEITLRDCNGVMCADVSKDGTTLIRGVAAVCNELLIPYEYLENGNFCIVTSANDVCAYSLFGKTQYLVYFTPDECLAARVKPASVVTESDFSPLGELPLRFKPVGYVLA